MHYQDSSAVPAMAAGTRSRDAAAPASAAGSPLLDTNTKYVCSAVLSNGESERAEVADRVRRRASKYWLQDRIRDVLNGQRDDKGRRFRTCLCTRALLPGGVTGELLRSELQKLGRFSKLIVCGSVWLCPVCSGFIAEGRRSQVVRCMEAHKAAGGQVLMITRTGAHTSLEPLRTCLDRFRGAERAMAQRHAYKALKVAYCFVGTITVLEVTYKATTGWHVHTHTLAFLEKPAADLAAFHADLFTVWRAGADTVGLAVSPDAFEVQATYGAVQDYVAKYGQLPERRPWGAEDEVTKAHTKRGRVVQGTYMPFDLAASADLALQARFVEYARAFLGRRRLVFSDGLLARLAPGEVDATDEELAVTPTDEWVFFDTFDEEQLKAACYSGKRDEWLRLVGEGDVLAARAFVDALVRRYRFLMAGYNVRDEAGDERVNARFRNRKDWLDTRDRVMGGEYDA